MSKVPPLQSSRQPVKSLTKLFTSLFTNTSSIDLPHLWEKSFKKMKRLQKKMDKQENSKSSHVYKYRMFDIIMGRTGSGNKSGSDPWENIFTLANAFGEKDTNIQILSPRIMPVLPSSQAKRGILSPAIFPLYHDESEQQILPIPKMLDKWGLSESDRNSILQMIMEISGARQTVEDAIEVVEHLGTVGIGDAIYRSAAKLKESFEKLKHSFDKKQKNSLKKRGFAIMDPEQTKRLHDDIGINKMAGHENFADSSSLTRSQRYQSLWKFVETIASKPCRRRKRQLGGGKPVFSVFAASILSPYMFAPVYGFSVLGPVVLSPNIFSPLILNPSVLGPWVLSPSVPLPFIVSPYLLSPYVLSPLVLAPFILSPYVISPNVINPYVLAPVILSPVVLSPDVISPMVLGGPILSPGVLSPSVLSKSAIMANILSPTVLSR